MKKAHFIFAFLFSFMYASAQDISLSGTIKESASKARIADASISLFDENKKLIVGAMSNDAGEFDLKKLKSGSYVLSIKFIGYTQKDTTVQLLKNRKHDLGDIFLISGHQQINEVNVIASNSGQQHQSDKQVYQANQYKSAVGGTALDIIKNLPSITLDGNGELLVRGNKGLIVLINGTPTLLDAQTILNQVSANDVKEVEFISSPRAQYDPDGKGGMINIKTNKPSSDGFAWLMNLQYGLPSIDDYDNLERQKRFGSDISFQYKRNKLDIQGSLNYLRNDNAGFRDGYVYTIIGDKKTMFPSQGERSFDKYNYGARLNTTYQFADNQKIQLGFLASKKFQDRVADIYYNNQSISTIDGSTIHRLRYFNPNLQNKQGKFYLVDLNYQLSLNKKHSLDIGLVYEHADIYGSTNNGNIENGNDTIQWTRNTYTNPLNGVRASAQHQVKLSDNSELISGYQIRRDGQRGDFRYLGREYGQRDFELIPEFSGKMNAENIVHALFSQFNRSYTNTNIALGLRYEFYKRDVLLVDAKEEYPYQTHQLYPSFDIKHKLDKGWELKMSASRRVQRNNNFELNPIPEREHSETLERGDAELLPEFVTNFETGVIKKFMQGLLFSNVYYQHSKNPIQRINSVYADTILHRVFTNADYARRYGLEVGGEWKPTSSLKLLLGANTYNYKIEGAVLDYVNAYKNSDWVYAINASGMLNLPRQWTAAVDVNYLSDRPTLQGIDSRFITPNFSLSKSFYQGAVTAQVQWKNIELGNWGVNEQRITTYANDFFTTTNYVYEKNIILLNLNFNIKKLNNILRLPKSEFGEKEF
ncbi:MULTISPECIES: TonB-dependent receptor [Sphingobacterium]|uniref:TonB-dependent receptor n=1 Tax=Sphingobacterium TaxID=28453 RepID=UPI001F08A7BC|nr:MULTISPECIES: outer membrane beta-barrel family protein [unclassified Sphingobacterium]